MSDSDDLFGDDPAMDEFAENFERDRDAIYELICDYMDEAEINEAYVAQLLIDAMIRMRMTAYGLGVESPSVAGLKIDLDRLRDEVGGFVREAKKGAEEYINHVKDMRARADSETEEDDEKAGRTRRAPNDLR
jgi:hypothetical protein